MVIGKDAVVYIDYVLKDDQGEVLDSSGEHGPLAYLHGNGQLIPGLENELEGKSAGDSFEAVIGPEMGYGEYDENLVVKIGRDRFDTNEEIEPGMQFQAQTPEGDRVFTIKDVSENEVTADGNHPLAGMELEFAVTVVNIREATTEELEHGHVHDGHNHH